MLVTGSFAKLSDDGTTKVVFLFELA